MKFAIHDIGDSGIIPLDLSEQTKDGKKILEQMKGIFRNFGIQKDAIDKQFERASINSKISSIGLDS